MARRLVEAGVRCVTLAFSRWDHHGDNFGALRQDLPLLDQGVSALVEDIHNRGLDKDVSVVVWGEFGRTPNLNEARGRDHFPTAWSMAMAGCGIKPGVVYGSTDANGLDVKENPVDQARLFATIFTALGMDPHQPYDLPGFPLFHRVENQAEPVREVLK